MFTIEGVVMFVLYILGCAMIFGILYAIIRKVASKWPDTAQFCNFAEIGLYILAGLVLIGIILSFMGHPIVTWNRPINLGGG
jgi:hypothetical protein